ncbi:MAG: D-alanyl-D-alanine carboxypeptidase, partial [Firmicutes bacterium]|nr:D-alanyl-D-alanine carboxypeptidase [Bacillota bacterium]
MRKTLICLTALFCMLAVSVSIGAVQISAAPEPKAALAVAARSAYLASADGRELFAKDENARLPIASMVKIMTLLLCYEHAAAGNMKFDDSIVISPNAAGMGGSQAFLDAG